jgi:hypothetical protein
MLAMDRIMASDANYTGIDIGPYWLKGRRQLTKEMRDENGFTAVGIMMVQSIHKESNNGYRKEDR